MSFTQFFIDGHWVDPVEPHPFPVEDPSTGEPFETVSLGSKADVDLAVAAARRAFAGWGWSEPAERLDLLRRIAEVYRRRWEDLAQAVSREMGAPIAYARDRHVQIGLAHFEKAAEVLSTFAFDEERGSALIAREPIGVAALITPWNWPLNQIVCKVAPALATGCTVVLKPSEIAPLDALILAEILDEAGVPAGVFNLVVGDGPTVGRALAEHPDVDMISFTGSTRAGVDVARAAAATVKRVSQELGGKSPNILLPDVDLAAAVARGAMACFRNSGQSCNAPTRMLVPRNRADEAAAIAKKVAEGLVVGPADRPGVDLGPVVSRTQFEKINALIESGIAEGARLAAGGPGRPEGLERGWFVRPTVFAGVTPAMRIAREEIFGPVLSILAYDDVEEAITIANDTVYGLAAYVQATDLAAARTVARRLRAGSVHLNTPPWDAGMPFGGYKHSGNGREYGAFGFAEFLETKGIGGWTTG